VNNLIHSTQSKHNVSEPQAPLSARLRLTPIGAAALALILVLAGPVRISLGQGEEFAGDTATGLVGSDAIPPQPSAQSSGMGIDVLGISTGNGASGSPEPDFNPNRSGPGINIGFGQVIFDQTDLFIKGRDEVTDLVIARRHLSRRDQVGSIFGPAWAFNYSHSLKREGTGMLVTSYGRTDLFKSTGTDVWEGTEGRFGRLTLTTADMYTLRMPHGTLLTFKGTAAVDNLAYLQQITSPNGNTLVFTYDPNTSGRLMKITDSFGRDINFTYNAAGYVTEIADFTAPEERKLVYTYDTDGRLTSARSPTVAGDGGKNAFPAGKTYEYKYLGSVAPQLKYYLNKVVFPNQVGTTSAPGTGKARYTWTYDPDNAATNTYFGYIKSLTIGEAPTVPPTPGAVSDGGTFRYSYRAIAAPPQQGDPDPGPNEVQREVTVTDRMGTKTVYKTNFLGQVLTEEVVSRRMEGEGIVPGESEPTKYSTSFQYNVDGQLTRRDDPMGSRTEFLYSNRDREANGINDEGPDYDAQNFPRNMEFPMTNVVRIPDTRGADQQLIQSKTIYEPIFNKPFKVIGPRGYDLVSAGLDTTNPPEQAADRQARKDKFTTTYTYDYMENLGANTATLVALLGVTDLTGLLPPDFPTGGTVAGTRTAGNLIRVNYPTVTAPDPKADPALDLTNLGFNPDSAESFTYNADGQLTQHVDADEKVTTHSYFNASDHHPSGSGTGSGYLMKTIRDDDGVDQTTSYQYTAQTPVLEQDGGATGSFPANLRGIPTAIIDPRGVKTAYLVNELDQVIKTVRATAVSAGTAFAYESLAVYDANNNVIERCVENELPGIGGTDLIKNTYTYDILDQVTESVQDVGGGPSETRIAYSYDESQNLLLTLRGDESTGNAPDQYALTAMGYDERDFLVTTTFAVGEGDAEEATFEQQRNANGHVVMAVDGEDAEGAAADAADGAIGGDPSKIRYDGFNRQIEVVERDGDITKYTYDSASNAISTENLSANRVRLAKSEISYDERNRAIRTDRHISHYEGQSVGTIHDVDANPGDGKLTSWTLYDSLNRVVATVDEEGGLTKTSYDGLSRPISSTDAADNITEWTYDQNSNVLTVKETELGASDPFVTIYTYDALNRRIELREPNDQATTYAYDSRGNLLKTTDAEMNVTEMTYDRLNRLTQEQIILANGNITKQYEYDDLHRLVARIDAKGARTSYTHDDLNRLTKTTFHDGSKEISIYNDDGERITFTDRNETEVTRTYDADSKLLTETGVATKAEVEIGGTTAKTWKYDGLDRVVEATDNNGQGSGDDVICTYIYDSLSRVIRENQSIGGVALKVDSEWQGSGRKVAIAYPNDRKVTRSYDALDRLAEIKEGENLIAHFNYVGPHRTAGATYGNNTELTKAYDNNRRATTTKWENTETGKLMTHYVNTFNGANRRISENRKHLNASPTDLDTNFDSYTLDAAYRMTGFRQDGSELNTGGILSTRTLDGADMMTALTEGSTDRMPKVDGVTPPTQPAAGLNQYTSLDQKPRLYDKNANLKNATGSKFFYDYDNRLVSVEDILGVVKASYTYAADGRRVLKKVGTAPEVVTRFLYDGWQVIEERSGTAENSPVLRQYIDGRGIDEHIQMRTYSGELKKDYYYHCNDQGFVGALSGADGKVVEYYKYDWLGRVTVLKAFN
jgi:YD repeat-containing protein